MRIVWDEPKRLANLKKHKLDFRDLKADWLIRLEMKRAKKNRWMVVGELGNHTIVVIFARLGEEAVSIVSMHRVDRDWIER